MMPLPPWLNVGPQTYLSAIEAGANMGLRRRAQATAEQEASDAAQLQQEHLGFSRQQAAQQAAEALRQHTALESYRNSLIAHQKAQEATAAARLDQQQARLDAQTAKEDAKVKVAADIDKDAAGFYGAVAGDTSAADALKQFPLAVHKPSVSAFLNETMRAKAHRGTIETDAIVDPTTGERIGQYVPGTGGAMHVKWSTAGKGEELTPGQQLSALRLQNTLIQSQLLNPDEETTPEQRKELLHKQKTLLDEARKIGKPTSALQTGQAPLPMPKTKEELVKGLPYQTKRGPARWNGEAFETE